MKTKSRVLSGYLSRKQLSRSFCRCHKAQKFNSNVVNGVITGNVSIAARNELRREKTSIRPFILGYCVVFGLSENHLLAEGIAQDEVADWVQEQT